MSSDRSDQPLPSPIEEGSSGKGQHAPASNISDAYVGSIGTILDALDALSRMVTGYPPLPKDVDAAEKELRDKAEQIATEVVAQALANLDVLEQRTGALTDGDLAHIAQLIKTGKMQEARDFIALKVPQTKPRVARGGRPPKPQIMKAGYECACQVEMIRPRYEEAIATKRELKRNRLSSTQIRKRLQAAGFKKDEIELVLTKRTGLSAACHAVAGRKPYRDPKTVQTYYARFKHRIQPFSVPS